jgi:ribonuclease R
MASAVIALQIGTTRLFAARKDRGSVAYADAAAGVLSSEDGILERVTESEFVGCMMVQEAMIAANEAISQYAAKNDIPIIYRNHTASIATPPKADVVAQLEQAKNLPLPHLSALIERVDVLLNRARYEAHVRGHFALCAPFYTHATSPIRRYADLVTQRQIVAHVQKERMPYTQRELVAMAAHINVTIDDAVNEQREELKARTISITESRLARDGYQGLNEFEFERVVHQLRSSSSMPSVEFVDDVVRRLESGSVTHRAIASLLPMLQSSALWEHVSSAICAKFAVEPEHATLALRAAKGLGLWSANVVDMMATKAPHPPMNSCVGTLMDGDQVFRGPKCFAAAQRTAWHRAVAAVVIQQLDGEVPKDWLSVAITGALAPLTTSHKHAVSELAELANRISKSPPLFVFAAEGPAHRPTFKCTCTVGGMKTSGSGRDKQTAKNMAASAMITKLSGGVKKEVRA